MPSRLVSRNRSFDAITSRYELTYTYNISDGLKSITDPLGQEIETFC